MHPLLATKAGLLGEQEPSLGQRSGSFMMGSGSIGVISQPCYGHSLGKKAVSMKLQGSACALVSDRLDSKQKKIIVFLLPHWTFILRLYFYLFLLFSASRLQSSVPQLSREKG